MTEFIVDKRDLRFVLYEHVDLEGLTKLSKYKDFGREDFEIILDEGIKIATDLLAPINKLGDEQGCKFENGQVTIPNAFIVAFKQFADAGWVAPQGKPEYGGLGIPLTLAVSLMECFIGANSSFLFFPALGAAAAHVIDTFGSQDQKDSYIGKMYEGTWTGTMCLTEAQAGTAVGELTTSATPVDGEDHYLISGSKIFISAGDHNATENIIHLVLARVPGDPEGTKGLSLFIVPKVRVNPDGSLGEPNDVVTAGIEHKLGIIASPTCTLNFGEEGRCHGYLIGERCKGIVYMFQMMNEARIVCGIQGSALANASYQHALAFARERIQGAKMTDRRPDAPKVPIIEHPDVRRNLMLMKCMSEGTRALLHNTAYYADLAESAESEKERERYMNLVELLTPICKAYATDQGFLVTERGIQVHGGYGYTTEYPAEQFMRDEKIASIYEGTNGIQALDLLGRKMRLKGGGLFMAWLQEINTFVGAHKSDPALGEHVGALDKAKNALGEVAFSFPAIGKANPDLFLLQASPFLEAMGHVELARLLLQQAVIAQSALAKLGVDGEDPEARRQRLEDDPEARFYDGKIQSARFFVQNVLPHAIALTRSMKSKDTSALDIVF